MKLYEQFFCEFFKKQSRSVTTRKSKVKQAASLMGTATARKKNDPLYIQMKRFCDKCKEYRQKINKKYAHKFRSKAMK